MPESSRFTYVQVAEALRADIAAARLKPGNKVPSIRDLAERYGIAPATVQNGLRLLRDEGLLFVGSTRGYFVGDEAPRLASISDEPTPDFTAMMAQLDTITDEVRELSKRVDALESNRRSGRSGSRSR